jgi:hypothetical protein
MCGCVDMFETDGSTLEIAMAKALSPAPTTTHREYSRWQDNKALLL